MAGWSCYWTATFRAYLEIGMTTSWISSSMVQANGPLYRNLAVLAIVASGAAVLFSLVIVPYLTTSAQESPSEERRILAIDSKYDLAAGRTITKIHHVKVGEMQSNSAFWFLDPFGRTMEAAAGER